MIDTDLKVTFAVDAAKYRRDMQRVQEQLADLAKKYPWESKFKVKTGRGGRRKRRARRLRQYGGYYFVTAMARFSDPVVWSLKRS